MDVTALLQNLSDAVEAAKAKAAIVSGLRSELASYTAAKQAQIDTALIDYTDAKVAADRLQDEARDAIGAILPAPDPRFRVTT